MVQYWIYLKRCSYEQRQLFPDSLVTHTKFPNTRASAAWHDLIETSHPNESLLILVLDVFGISIYYLYANVCYVGMDQGTILLPRILCLSIRELWQYSTLHWDSSETWTNHVPSVCRTRVVHRNCSDHLRPDDNKYWGVWKLMWFWRDVGIRWKPPVAFTSSS